MLPFNDLVKLIIEMKRLIRVLDKMFSTSAAGLYMVLFAVSIGVATFVENDFGTSSAQKVIFKSAWFELILVLFGISLIVNIFRFRMIQQKKWPLLMFHASMIIILIGAGVTRYFGSEGMMGIREGSASNSFLSTETYLLFQTTHEGRKYNFEEPVLFATLGDNSLKESYLIGSRELQVEVLDFIPNPTEVMVDDDQGVPVLKTVIAGINGREEYLIEYGDKVNIYGTLFNFGNEPDNRAFNIAYRNDSLYFLAGTPYTQMVMATQTRDTLPPGAYHPLKLRSMYSDGMRSFVFGAFSPHARTEVKSASEKMLSTSTGGVRLKINFGGEEKELFVSGSQGMEGTPRVAAFGNSSVAVAYGAKRVTLPFSIKLNDFIMERYPGTNSASSYASEVTLIDPRENLVRDQRIYMNHILDYDGYRFFQSSFDQDELGTYLSVNHDAPGTLISYLGYALLTLGMIMTLVSKNTRFAQLSKNVKNMRNKEKVLATLLGCILSFSTPALADNISGQRVNEDHAIRFGEVLMQDHRGRLKPINTFAGEVLRKLSKKEKLYGQIPEQIILGMAANPKNWYDVPLIKLGNHEEVRKILNISGDMASYSDFFHQNGEYKLKEAVRNAYNAAPRDRGVFEKEIVKLDEKVNICSMVFSGRFLSVFPVPGDTTNHWLSPVEVPHNHNAASGGTIIEKFYPAYIPALNQAIQTNDWNLVNRMVDELKQYQQKYGAEILPSESKVQAELLLNKLNVFSRLGKFYGLLGLAFLSLLFISVFNPKTTLKWAGKIAVGLLFFGFFMHTLGLGLRWYVAGRAPWSNGYESMIYIGWTTILAGLIFGRKNFGGLAATSVLASIILMVAGLSWLDPEITPLVPVLKSYWLTIHVSLEAGSYGFLALGAIIGVLNLVFMLFANQRNRERIYRIVKEMTYISEMTLIGGLFMISIGTYLGGVWANESWGRYWGWDAKETWALVTILVYSFILHMRFIPGLRGLYAFNVATLFGWASVMMTYLGVNYYLSGLHSYAAGDPVPIPMWVYWTVGALTVLSLGAFWRHRRNSKTLSV